MEEILLWLEFFVVKYVLTFTGLHTETELVCQGCQDLMVCWHLEWIIVVEEELYPAFQAFYYQSVDQLMHFYVLEDLELGLEVTFPGQFQVIDEHFHPKFIGRVWLEDYSGDIVPQSFNNIK